MIQIIMKTNNLRFIMDKQNYTTPAASVEEMDGQAPLCASKMSSTIDSYTVYTEEIDW